MVSFVSPPLFLCVPFSDRMVAKFPNNDVRKALDVVSTGTKLEEIPSVFAPEDITLALIRVVCVLTFSISLLTFFSSSFF